MKKVSPTASQPDSQEIEQQSRLGRMGKKELTRRLHELQKLPPLAGGPTALDTEVLTVLHELETYQIELEIQNLELRESRQALEESQDRYINLYDFAPAGYLTLSGQGLIQELNLTAASMFGVERSWLVGRLLASWILSSDLAQYREHLKKCAHSGESVTTVLRIARRDKTVLTVELLSTKHTDSSTGDPQFRSTMTDISHRKQMEDALTFEKHKSDTFFQQSPAAMALWSGPDFVFEKVNKTYQAIFQNRTLEGKPLLEALPELRGQIFPKLLQEVLQTGVSFVGRDVLAQLRPVPDGELVDLYFDFTYARIMDLQRKPWGVFAHAVDVTEKVKARKELEEEREVRERFVAALSHDLRTPMTSAKITAQLLNRNAQTPEKVGSLSLRIISAMDRADRMIRDLLDANRIKAGEGIPITINDCRLDELLERVVVDLCEIHGPRFTIQNKTGVIEGRWDAICLQRVIENLGGNAIKYGKPGTPVSITLSCEKNWVNIAVHNEGQPIALADQATLFEPYRRTKSADSGPQKGWGIGLTLVKGIAEAHGGTATVESGPETGTTFHIRLPL